MSLMKVISHWSEGARAYHRAETLGHLALGKAHQEKRDRDAQFGDVGGGGLK
jgi:hypothetical protein